MQQVIVDESKVIRVERTEYRREGNVIRWYFKGREEGQARYATEREAIEVMEDLS